MLVHMKILPSILSNIPTQSDAMMRSGHSDMTSSTSSLSTSMTGSLTGSLSNKEDIHGTAYFAEIETYQVMRFFIVAYDPVLHHESNIEGILVNCSTSITLLDVLSMYFLETPAGQ